MIAASRIRLKRVLTYLFCLILLLLVASLTIYHKKTVDNTLPFKENEPFLPDSNQFLYLDDVFKQPVPNITHFRYHQSSAKPCYRDSPTLLIIVHSAPAHILHRKAIRRTWGSSTKDLTIRTVFVVGRSSQPQVWQRVKHEARDHNDIVLVDMLDTYNNLTLKHLISIRWVLNNCPRVSFVLKADDDAFIDMHRVASTVIPNLPLHTIACRIVPSGTAPRRSGKWKVTRDEYPFDDYPEYCSGLAYFARPYTMERMYKAAVSGNVPYLWIDDVFMTGFSAAFAGIKRMDLSVWFARTEEQVIRWLKNDTIFHRLPWMVVEMTPRHWPFDAIAVWNKTKIAELHEKT